MLFSIFKDAFAKGEIVLGTKGEGYDITTDFAEKQPPQGYGFEITTPGRKYEFSAASEEERDEWVNVLNDVMAVSMSPVEKEGESLIYIDGLTERRSEDNVNR